MPPCVQGLLPFKPAPTATSPAHPPATPLPPSRRARRRPSHGCLPSCRDSSLSSPPLLQLPPRIHRPHLFHRLAAHAVDLPMDASLRCEDSLPFKPAPTAP